MTLEENGSNDHSISWGIPFPITQMDIIVQGLSVIQICSENKVWTHHASWESGPMTDSQNWCSEWVRLWGQLFQSSYPSLCQEEDGAPCQDCNQHGESIPPHGFCEYAQVTRHSKEELIKICNQLLLVIFWIIFHVFAYIPLHTFA